ncbi:MAG: helix-turn-helix transcriptional regulator [Paludibacteraceae bacterium]|nr:helix-turn-helix transcriptional regulator [Paludibacteraceae bacterium]MBP7219018.1 helix-turn-helix transcriptional regulator [Paludibacteraceae bacterium]MBP8627983.1 helix-turn-helix transcriptional regulator [Paludibacteraceae bacterium]MBP8782112.1 helix-turn-helix transcriptional regulator [Paludibacteraceae bacterium]MBP9648346.1 helix-turn-helix transcriptional regulator [Paludibacteraceae bacterium]
MSDKDLFELVGIRIRNIRKSQGVSQQILAYEVDMEKTNISRIEAGRTNVTIKNLYKIAQALGVTMKDIVDIEREHKETKDM